MKVLFLSFYYTPDLCAGSFRAGALIQALQPNLPAGSHIDVLTTMPNRYSSFSATADGVETHGALSIRRIPLPSHKSGMRDQSKAFVAYARGVLAHVRHREYDLVFATSSRLMTAVLGAYVARRQKAPLYLDIRDIFVDTIRDVLPHGLARPMGVVFSALEGYAIRSARKVNLVSRGFEGYFSGRYPGQAFSYFPNGIDDEFLVPVNEAQTSAAEPRPPYSVLYAGNLGEGQGLHMILPGLAKVMQGQANFTIIGDGGRKPQLRQALAEAGASNVQLLDPVNREALVRAYQNADVLFLHLNDYDAFRKVLPSKLFEYAAVGKPIWAGVAGYSAEFIRTEIPNAAVFAPCDVAEAVRVFPALTMQPTPRADFIRKYARQRIMQALAHDIVSIAS